MKVLLINQVFYPDVASTAQHLTDLSLDLAAKGHELTVVTGSRGYDDPSRHFPKREVYRGMTIIRVPYLPLGKKSKAARILSIVSFYFNVCWRLLFLGKHDVVVSLTTPALLPVVAALYSQLRGSRLITWLMDLNPDEAIAAGWIRERSFLGRLSSGLTRWSLHQSETVVALDPYMKDRLIGRYQCPSSKVFVIPPWAHDDKLRTIRHEENPFRKQFGFEKKFVVMYSGNHSICHSLDTLLAGAERLKNQTDIVFCFIGGGALVARVRDFKTERKLENIVQLPYQPLERLSESLSAADLQVTVMGEAFVGIVHPCKVYGILAVGRPFVFVGPRNSPTGQIIDSCALGYQVDHGQADDLIKVILEVRAMDDEKKRWIEKSSQNLVSQNFSKSVLSPRLAELVISGQSA